MNGNVASPKAIVARRPYGAGSISMWQAKREGVKPLDNANDDVKKESKPFSFMKQGTSSMHENMRWVKEFVRACL